MITHILVRSYRPDQMEAHRGQCLVLRLNGPEEIEQASGDVRRYDINLHCFLLSMDLPLAAVPFKESWINLPIALSVPTMGRVRDLVRQIGLIRRLNLRVYLSGEKENLTSLRILSSLGVHCAVDLHGAPMDWESAVDLMTYALLGTVPHGTIEPFEYVAAHYAPTEPTDFGGVYFNDPSRYLHLDDGGNLALTREDLVAGRFIAGSTAVLGDLDSCEEYRDHFDRRRDLFLKFGGCACCAGWRVCLGKFPQSAGNGAGCVKMFSELLDTAEQRQAQRSQTRTLWQP